MKIRGKKGEPLMLVDNPHLHCLYHVAWSFRNGVVGRCVAIDVNNKTVTLRSPKTKIDWANQVKWSDLRHTRHMAFKIKQSGKDNNK